MLCQNKQQSVGLKMTEKRRKYEEAVSMLDLSRKIERGKQLYRLFTCRCYEVPYRGDKQKYCSDLYKILDTLSKDRR